MAQLQHFRIALEFWAIIFGIVAAVCVFATRSFHRKAAVTLTLMLAADVVMNTVDILLVILWEREYGGRVIPGILATIVYLCAFLFLLLYAQHIAEVIIIRENQDGKGTLTIRSYRTPEAHVIEVMDDGNGFDPEAMKAGTDGHAHIGLQNIEMRLKMMCHGTLSIESSPGMGTLARVEIPIN